MRLPSFSQSELACKGNGILILAPGFAQALQGLRDALHRETGRGMVLNSACRSKAHNVAVNGHPRSLHVGDFPHWPTGGCCAVDVRAIAGRDDDYRKILDSLAWERGWSVGNHTQFLHLDLRTEYAGFEQKRFNY
jgi:hypothetical protein